MTTEEMHPNALDRFMRKKALQMRINALTGLPHANPFPVRTRWDTNPLQITLCFEEGFHTKDYKSRHVVFEDDPATFPSDTLIAKISAFL